MDNKNTPFCPSVMKVNTHNYADKMGRRTNIIEQEKVKTKG